MRLSRPRSLHSMAAIAILATCASATIVSAEQASDSRPAVIISLERSLIGDDMQRQFSEHH